MATTYEEVVENADIFEQTLKDLHASSETKFKEAVQFTPPYIWIWIGGWVTGNIDGKFDNGYFVTVNMGSQKLKGVLSHSAHEPPPTPEKHNQKRPRQPSSFPGKGYNNLFAERYDRLKPFYDGQEGSIGKKIRFLWNRLSEAKKQVLGYLCGFLMEDQLKDDDDVPTREEEEETSVCKVCNKGFSSGKALGGHMRVHSNSQVEVEVDGGNAKMMRIQHQKRYMGKKNRLSNLSVNPSSSSYNVNNNNQSTETSPNSSSNSNTTTCSLCNKIFPSKKSLFGHMRCHPERDYRGMTKNSSSSTISDSMAPKMDDRIDSVFTSVGPLKNFPIWVVTGQRGRKSVDDEEEENKGIVPEAVYDLMLLANGGHSFQPPAAVSRKSYSEYDASNLGTSDQLKKRRIEERGGEDRIMMRPKKLRFDEGGLSKWRNGELGNEFQWENAKEEKEYGAGAGAGVDPEFENVGYQWKYSDDSEDDLEQPSEERLADFNTKRKYKKKIKMRDLESVQAKSMMDSQRNSDSYKCTTCNKTFPSHQALGGHRSSHNKGKNILLRATNAITDMEEFASAEKEHYELPTNLSTVNNSPESDDKVANPHKCQICSKAFATGQALGGHKRCHWNGPEAPTSSSAASVSPEEVSRTGVALFDLNELPMMEQEEEHALEFASAIAPITYNFISY
ncbi:hypothetical protein GIB67_033331 [Kingdonia uniflora]|uniref:C2H2-type domain-containing protein n=1 Tax=Kingdonia uniflora TaxID=39325 RepID=A0A7J7LTV5_9MAGN|nr:hypothetical protein GIB67_033331 [Kingdonia uniflora]